MVAGQGVASHSPIQALALKETAAKARRAYCAHNRDPGTASNWENYPTVAIDPVVAQ